MEMRDLDGRVVCDAASFETRRSRDFLPSPLWGEGSQTFAARIPNWRLDAAQPPYIFVFESADAPSTLPSALLISTSCE